MFGDDDDDKRRTEGRGDLATDGEGGGNKFPPPMSSSSTLEEGEEVTAVSGFEADDNERAAELPLETGIFFVFVVCLDEFAGGAGAFFTPAETREDCTFNFSTEDKVFDFCVLEAQSDDVFGCDDEFKPDRKSGLGIVIPDADFDVFVPF
jgi:hypothetical protein